MSEPNLPTWRIVVEHRHVTSFDSEYEARAGLDSPFLDPHHTVSTQITTLEQWQEASVESGLPGTWHTVEERRK